MIVLIAHGSNVIAGQKIIIHQDQQEFKLRYIKDGWNKSELL